jgi:hypothetical protein
MKTAIEEMMDIMEMDHNNGVEYSMKVFYGMLKEAKKIEQEQILQAFVAGSERGTNNIPFNAEQYYTQNYLT